MSGVDDKEAVSCWRTRGLGLLDAIRGRSKAGAVIASEVVERLIDQERDIEALLGLLLQERERNDVLRAAHPGFAERQTVDGEIERLRDYALSLRHREVALERGLNSERQKVATLEAALLAVGGKIAV